VLIHLLLLIFKSIVFVRKLKLNMSRTKNFAILLYPSRTENKQENDRIRDICCKVCGYPFAQGGERCDCCINLSGVKIRENIGDSDAFIYGVTLPIQGLFP